MQRAQRDSKKLHFASETAHERSAEHAFKLKAHEL